MIREKERSTPNADEPELADWRPGTSGTLEA